MERNGVEYDGEIKPESKVLVTVYKIEASTIMEEKSQFKI